MNKIESARIIVKQRGICYNFNHSETIDCDDCFNGRNRKKCVDFTDEKILALAEAYIKRHDQKCKKKDHIRDATKKVEEPKPVEEPTPLEIAKMIRDNGYSCLGLIKNCPPCPLWGKGDCGTSDKTVEENHIKRKQLIDDYISANEPKPVKKVGVDNDDVTLAKPTVKENLSVPCEHLVNGDSCGNAFEPCDKDCPANSEYPDPIRVDIPDIFYCPTPQGILRFKRSQILLKDTNNDDCLLKYHEEYPCYRTPEEALQVAKKLWQGEKK